MSDAAAFPFAFGHDAAEQFKERLKELVRAQQEAFEEVQAERPQGASAPAAVVPDPVSQAIALTGAAMSALEPRATPQDAAEAMAFIFARAMTLVQRAAGQGG